MRELPDPKTGNSHDRINLAWGLNNALGKIGPASPSAQEVLGVLKKEVESGDWARQIPAAWALGEFGTSAQAAIPALVKMITEPGPSRGDREAAAVKALSSIARDTPAADTVLPQLAGVLDSDSATARLAAIEALKPFGPKAAAAIPRVRALREDRDVQVRQAAASALVAIEGSSKP
jgi:HEAT repeat protein